MQLGLLKFMIFFLIKTIKSEKLLCNDLKVIELRRMLYLITAPLGTDFNDSNSISWIRVPDENPFFQEFIFIWHFNANLVQNTNIQDDNDSNSQFRIVFEGWIREKWPKMKDMLEISETESWNPISNRANIISLIRGARRYGILGVLIYRKLDLLSSNYC